MKLGSQSTKVDRAVLVLSAGAVVPATNPICAQGGEMSEAEMQQLVRTFNAEHEECQLAVESIGGKPGLVPNAACRRSGPMANVGLVSETSLVQTASWVTVHSGLFSIMSEQEVAGVLAHELGHYYRSHGTGSFDEYLFFYRLEEKNPNHRPKADKSLEEIGNSAYVSTNILAAAGRLKEATSQRYHSALYFTLGTLVRALTATSGSAASCETASRLITSAEFTEATGRFPLQALRPVGAQKYREFEQSIRECLKTATAGADGLNMETFIRAAVNPTWPGWTSVNPEYVKPIAQLMSVVLRAKASSLTEGETIADLVDVLNAGVKQAVNEATGTLKKVHDERVGFYTAEQEADELSAEWLTMVGFPAKESANGYVALMKYVDQALRSVGRGPKAGEMSYDECMALHQSGWKKDGSYVFAPIADFADTHHSLCYRVFNVDREVEAHGFKNSGANPPLFKDAEYAAIQDEAKKVNEEVNSLIDRGGWRMLELGDDLSRAILGDCEYSKSHLVHPVK